LASHRRHESRAARGSLHGRNAKPRHPPIACAQSAQRSARSTIGPGAKRTATASSVGNVPCSGPSLEERCWQVWPFAGGGVRRVTVISSLESFGLSLSRRDCIHLRSRSFGRAASPAPGPTTSDFGRSRANDGRRFLQKWIDPFNPALNPRATVTASTRRTMWRRSIPALPVQ
jgi:hypothetical protein